MSLAELCSWTWAYAVLPLFAVAGLLGWLPARRPADRTSTAPAFGGILAASPAAIVGCGSAIALGGAGVLPWLALFIALGVGVRRGVSGATRPSKTWADTVLDCAIALAVAVTAAAALAALAREAGWRDPAIWAVGPCVLGGIVAVVCTAAHGRAQYSSPEVGGQIGVEARRPARREAEGVLPVLRGRATQSAGMHRRRGGHQLPGSCTQCVLGTAAMLGILAVIVAAASAIAPQPGAAARTVARAVQEAFAGARELPPFTGTTAREVLVAAALGLLPWVTLDAVASATAAQSPSAAKWPRVAHPRALALGMLAVVTLALASTLAYARPTEQRCSLRDVMFVTSAFETVSQRLESDRLFSGYVRIVGGETGGQSVQVATERGVIDAPRFEYYGRPADLALRVRDGKPFAALRRVSGALTEIPPAQLDHVEVCGQMLPSATGVLLAAVGSDSTRASWAQWLLLVGCLLLGVTAVAASARLAAPTRLNWTAAFCVVSAGASWFACTGGSAESARMLTMTALGAAIALRLVLRILCRPARKP